MDKSIAKIEVTGLYPTELAEAVVRKLREVGVRARVVHPRAPKSYEPLKP